IIFNGTLIDNNLAFEAQVQVLAQGGKVSSAQDGSVSVNNADTALLILSVGTNYALDYPTYRGENPHAAVQKRVDQAATKSYAELLTNHQADYRELYGRVAL